MAYSCCLSMATSSWHWFRKQFAQFGDSSRCYLNCSYRFLLTHSNPLCIYIIYFISISFVGFFVLKSLNLKKPLERPRDIDMFFTSVSAATVSSMSTVEMEVFSNSQLLVLSILMLIGGEVFTSMLGLQFRRQQLRQQAMFQSPAGSVVAHAPSVSGHIEMGSSADINGQVEMGSSAAPDLDRIESGTMGSPFHLTNIRELKYNAITYLAYLVMGYLLLIHVSGFLSVLVYVDLVTSARDVLKGKGIQVETFSLFTTVSSFSNCGFIPTNENMMVFRKNSGLLLLIIPQVLLGNTLFPPFLRLLIWVLKIMTKREEFVYLLKDSRQIGYYHLLPYLHSLLLVATVLLFMVIQLILLCALEWRSEALSGLNFYQKVIGALFLSSNSRHAGESVVDLSTISPAILVLFVVMMYLPPYTSFIPFDDESCTPGNHIQYRKRMSLFKILNISQLSYIAIFVILICITERKKLSADPLNFNVFNIVIEVVSAYGNVGFSTGYSCSRQLKPDGACKDEWYGFVGKWSNNGKLILIFVMFFGRLKKYSMSGGKAWKLN